MAPKPSSESTKISKSDCLWKRFLMKIWHSIKKLKPFRKFQIFTLLTFQPRTNMDGDLHLPPSLSTIRALVRVILLYEIFDLLHIFMKIEMRRSRKTFILYPDYSTQQIKYKEPKVEKEVKKVTFNSQHVEKPSIFQSSQEEEKLFICALSSCKSKGICFKKIPSQPRPSFIKGDLLNCPPPLFSTKMKKD